MQGVIPVQYVLALFAFNMRFRLPYFPPNDEPHMTTDHTHTLLFPITEASCLAVTNLFNQLMLNNEFRIFLEAVNAAKERIEYDANRIYNQPIDDLREMTVIQQGLYHIVNYVFNIQDVMANHGEADFPYNGHTLGDFIQQF